MNLNNKTVIDATLAIANRNREIFEELPKKNFVCIFR